MLWSSWVRSLRFLDGTGALSCFFSQAFVAFVAVTAHVATALPKYDSVAVTLKQKVQPVPLQLS